MGFRAKAIQIPALTDNGRGNSRSHVQGRLVSGDRVADPALLLAYLVHLTDTLKTTK